MPSRILRLWNPAASAWEEVGDSRLTAHLAAADPHPTYLQQSEADARYAPIGGGGGTTDVTVTTDASLTATESPANTFALAVRLSPDAGNALALRGNGLYGTDTTGGGGGGLATDPLADAKGDAFFASGPDAVGRLPLGTDGHVLTADATQALGVRWAAAAGGGGGLPTTGGTMTGTITSDGTDADVQSGGALRVTGPTAPVADTRIYGASSPAITLDQSMASGREYGIRFARTGADYLVAVRWYRPAGATPTPATCRLWDTTSTATPVWSTTALSGWQDTAVGWKEQRLPAGTQPLLVSGRTYVLSYTTGATGTFGDGTYTPVPDSGGTFDAHVTNTTGGAYPSTTGPNAWMIDGGFRATLSAPTPAASGAIRLANDVGGAIAWRDAVDGADLALTVNASDQLTFNGVPLEGGGGDYLPLGGGTLTGDLTLSEATPTVGLKQAADTQPRSRLSDTALAFGPGGSTAPDATLARTGAGALRVDTHLGVGVNPGTWSGAYRALQLGAAASAWANTGTSADLYLSSNSTYDGTGRKALVAAEGYEMGLIGGIGWRVATAPSVAAGAAQTFTTRLALSQQGTLTLTPDAGQAALVANLGGGATLTVQKHSSTNSTLLLPQAGQWIEVANAGALAPYTDNAIVLGYTANRWAAVYAVNGTIQTSSREAKQDITPLDPAACAQAVLDTDWSSFEYTPPPLTPGPPGETPAQSSARVSAHSRMVQETAAARRQNGFVLQSPQHRVSDLFGLSDRQSTNASSDLAVVAAALQDALRRIALLETP